MISLRKLYDFRAHTLLFRTKISDTLDGQTLTKFHPRRLAYPRAYLLTEISKISVVVKTWIINYIHITLYDIIPHPYPDPIALASVCVLNRFYV